MDFKKLIVKNIKKIIIICLIFLILSKKVSENFTTTQALDAVAATETKVNNMVINAGADHIDLKSKIRLSKSWSGYPDKATDQAEISNDTGLKKKLMIVGNKSSGTRKVGVWDHLDVHGNQGITGSLAVNGNVKGKRLCIGGTCVDENVLKRLNNVQKNPTKKGCNLYTEQVCHRNTDNAPPTHHWFYDGTGSVSKAHCQIRVNKFNEWCGSTDFKLVFNA